MRIPRHEFSALLGVLAPWRLAPCQAADVPVPRIHVCCCRRDVFHASEGADFWGLGTGGTCSTQIGSAAPVAQQGYHFALCTLHSPTVSCRRAADTLALSSPPPRKTRPAGIGVIAGGSVSSGLPNAATFAALWQPPFIARHWTTSFLTGRPPALRGPGEAPLCPVRRPSPTDTTRDAPRVARQRSRRRPAARPCLRGGPSSTRPAL